MDHRPRFAAFFFAPWLIRKAMAMTNGTKEKELQELHDAILRVSDE
jgi:hypothetical protein